MSDLWAAGHLHPDGQCALSSRPTDIFEYSYKWNFYRRNGEMITTEVFSKIQLIPGAYFSLLVLKLLIYFLAENSWSLRS